MPIARTEPQDARVIAHVDMDCFYVQVEQRRNPELRGLPTAVVQYNSWKGGGLIAVGYEARKFGVKRSMRGDEAKKVCPDINLVQVPVARGKADLNVYRSAGSEVVSILSTKGRCERASIDEVYLDLTDAAESMLSETSPDKAEEIDEEALKSHVLGLNEDENCPETSVKKWICRADADHRDKLLACGAVIVARLRMQVLEATTFTCSAGIAHNKMLAKLASAMHKPAQQTVVPSSSVKNLLASLPIKKMKHLGGKLGSSLQSDLGINTVGDLIQFSKEKLQDRYGINTGTWLWNTSRGLNGEEVQGRLLPKSHGCGKTFPGPQALRTIASVEKWLNELCEELSDRLQTDLEKNKRVAQTLTLHAVAVKANDTESHKKYPSKSCPLRYGTAKLQEDALRLFEAGLREYLGLHTNGWGITSLSVTASKIFAAPTGTSSILKFFHGNDSLSSSKQAVECVVQRSADCLPSSPSDCEQIFEHHHIDDTNRPVDEDIASDRYTSLSDETLLTIEPITRKPKGKEPCSILKFFHSSKTSCSSSNQEYDTDIAASSQLEVHKSALYKVEHQRPLDGKSDSDQTMRKSDVWQYDSDDIDLGVVNELPLEIQREVREWLRPRKQTKMGKRGSSIADYFSPVKK